MNLNRPLDLFISPLVELLELRCNVFDSPSEVEGKVMMWLQQAKESKSKEFIVDLLNKSAFVMLKHLKLEGQEENNAMTLPKQKTRKIDLSDTSNLDIVLSTMKRDELRVAEVPLDRLKAVLVTPRRYFLMRIFNC